MNQQNLPARHWLRRDGDARCRTYIMLFKVWRTRGLPDLPNLRLYQKIRLHILSQRGLFVYILITTDLSIYQKGQSLLSVASCPPVPVVPECYKGDRTSKLCNCIMMILLSSQLDLSFFGHRNGHQPWRRISHRPLEYIPAGTEEIHLHGEVLRPSREEGEMIIILLPSSTTTTLYWSIIWSSGLRRVCITDLSPNRYSYSTGRPESRLGMLVKWPLEEPRAISILPRLRITRPSKQQTPADTGPTTSSFELEAIL